MQLRNQRRGARAVVAREQLASVGGERVTRLRPPSGRARLDPFPQPPPGQRGEVLASRVLAAVQDLAQFLAAPPLPVQQTPPEQTILGCHDRLEQLMIEGWRNR